MIQRREVNNDLLIINEYRLSYTVKFLATNNYFLLHTGNNDNNNTVIRIKSFLAYPIVQRLYEVLYTYFPFSLFSKPMDLGIIVSTF